MQLNTTLKQNENNHWAEKQGRVSYGDFSAHAARGSSHTGCAAVPAGKIAITNSKVQHPTHNDLTHKEQGDSGSTTNSKSSCSFLYDTLRCAPQRTEPQETSSSTSVLLASNDTHPYAPPRTENRDGSSTSVPAYFYLNQHHVPGRFIVRTANKTSKMKTHHRVPGKFVVRSTTTKTTKLQTSLRRVALLGLLLLLLLPAALAFGIKPAQKSITFEPNLTVDAQFDLVRDTEAPGIAIISIEGDLAPYLTLPQTTIPVSGSAQSIKYSIKLPESLPAGTHVGKLIVTEQSSATGVINSRVRITFKVLVTVPGENLPITAEVVNHQNILYIEPSVTLNTPLNVQLNEREFASLGLLTLIGILALYTSLVLRIR